VGVLQVTLDVVNDCFPCCLCPTVWTTEGILGLISLYFFSLLLVRSSFYSSSFVVNHCFVIILIIIRELISRTWSKYRIWGAGSHQMERWQWQSCLVVSVQIKQVRASFKGGEEGEFLSEVNPSFKVKWYAVMVGRGFVTCDDLKKVFTQTAPRIPQHAIETAFR